MACSCHTDTCQPPSPPTGSTTADTSPQWRKALWIALVINALMFGVELWAGLHAGSVSLLADAVDFAGDAANYGISLAVAGMAIGWRSRAALVKGVSMFGYGLFVLGRTAWAYHLGTVPEATTMGVVATIAMAANVGVAGMLYAFRTGDANMRSVWICSRNDALSNLAVVLAAVGVFGTHTAWPDWAVALGMAALALSGGVEVMRHALRELSAERLTHKDPNHPTATNP
jgi:Co/Zn/Cd efflux system component